MSQAPIPSPEPTTAAGSGMKIFVILLGGFLVCCALCCGGVIGAGWWLGGKVKEVADQTIRLEDDPVEIEARADDILPMTRPLGLQPEMSMELSNPFSNELIYGITTFRDESNGTVLMIAEFGKSYEGGLDPEQMRREIEKQLEKQGEQLPEEVNTQQTDTIMATIHGEPANFIVLRGSAREQQPGEEEPQTVEQVILQGQFKTDRGTGFLILQGNGDQLTDEELQRLVESMDEGVD